MQVCFNFSDIFSSSGKPSPALKSPGQQLHAKVTTTEKILVLEFHWREKVSAYGHDICKWSREQWLQLPLKYLWVFLWIDLSEACYGSLLLQQDFSKVSVWEEFEAFQETSTFYIFYMASPLNPIHGPRASQGFCTKHRFSQNLVAVISWMPVTCLLNICISDMIV